MKLFFFIKTKGSILKVKCCPNLACKAGVLCSAIDLDVQTDRELEEEGE